LASVVLCGRPGESLSLPPSRPWYPPGPVPVGAGVALVRIEPGHDAWVTGAEPVVAYEFERETADTSAKPAS